jgi:hypothetical protein
VRYAAGAKNVRGDASMVRLAILLPTILQQVIHIEGKEGEKMS